MLLMNKLNIDLRKYLQQNHNQLTWKERIQIITDITLALQRIHKENAIHRDLHSGNILFKNYFGISDLRFCRPADKPLKSIYRNLPYIAPEVIIGRKQTFKSDIYSIAMLMWEISSGQPPFIDCEHDYDLAMNIVNGIRPKIVPGTPLEYKNLMKQSFHSNKSYDFHIPNNIDDFNKLSNIRNDYKIEAIQQQTMNRHIKDNDEDEAHNNPNLHSEEQDELELPD
ncbi:kinase-like domain-containing protein, partial [Rhizophagus diaphanus]